MDSLHYMVENVYQFLVVPNFRLTLVLTTTTMAVVYFKRKYSFWRCQGIMGPSPFAPIGTLHCYKRGTIHDTEQELMAIYGQNNQFHNLVGMYDGVTPVLLINDPAIVKEVCVSTFSSFTGNCRFFGHHIIKHFFIQQEGEAWKRLRAKASPVFSAGKIKQMLPIMVESVDQLSRALEKKVGLSDSNDKITSSANGKIANRANGQFVSNNNNDKTTVDIRHYVKYLTIDIITRAAFATEILDPYEKGQDDPFTDNLLRVAEVNTFKFLIGNFLPWNLKQWLNFCVTPIDRTEFAISFIQEMIKRKAQGTGDKRNYQDFLDLYLAVSDEQGNKLTENEVIANSFLILVAGFETTASLLTFAIFLLSFFPDKQERLFQEVLQLSKEKDLDYDSVTSLEYLDAVINETLRYFPPLLRFDRICTENITLSNGLFIPKGTIMRFPVYSMHHQEEYWPDNMEFKPERFLPENKDSLVPYAFIPFVTGPRSCLGNRFALLEAKWALSQLILRFRFSRPPGDKADYKNIEGNAVLICPKNVYVDFERRTEKF